MDKELFKNGLGKVVSEIRKKSKILFDRDFEMLSKSICGTPFYEIIEKSEGEGYVEYIRVIAPSSCGNIPYVDMRFQFCSYTNDKNDIKVIKDNPVRSWINLDKYYIRLFIYKASIYESVADIDVDVTDYILGKGEEFYKDVIRIKESNKVSSTPPPKFDTPSNLDKACACIIGG